MRRAIWLCMGLTLATPLAATARAQTSPQSGGDPSSDSAPAADAPGDDDHGPSPAGAPGSDPAAGSRGQGDAAAAASPSRTELSRNPLVRRGLEEYDDLRFEEAIQTLSAALVRSGNSTADLATIYRLLAYTYLALERGEEAAGAYRSLLAIEPDFVPGSEVSPQMRAFFVSVAESWEAEGRPGLPSPSPVAIRHVSPAQAESGTAVTLSAEVDNIEGSVAEVVLAYRQGSNQVFRRVVAARADGRYVAVVPAADVRPPLVEYYFEAVDDRGLPVASRGDVAAPLRIAVPEEGSSVLGSWWFWTGVGLVVAGAVTAALLLAGGGDGEQQGTFIVTVF